MQAKLDSQKQKRQQLEEEVLASQVHIAELTAILKSAVMSNGTSGPTGIQSPRSAALSREDSSGEVGPRLRSKELQGELCVYSSGGALVDSCCLCADLLGTVTGLACQAAVTVDLLQCRSMLLLSS